MSWLPVGPLGHHPGCLWVSTVRRDSWTDGSDTVACAARDIRASFFLFELHSAPAACPWGLFADGRDGEGASFVDKSQPLRVSRLPVVSPRPLVSVKAPNLNRCLTHSCTTRQPRRERKRKCVLGLCGGDETCSLHMVPLSLLLRLVPLLPPCCPFER